MPIEPGYHVRHRPTTVEALQQLVGYYGRSSPHVRGRGAWGGAIDFVDLRSSLKTATPADLQESGNRSTRASNLGTYPAQSLSTTGLRSCTALRGRRGHPHVWR